MNETFELRDLYWRLQEDQWRKSNPFAEDVLKVQEVLFSPFARPVDRHDIVSWWLQEHQPCVFGKIAAAKGWMHYCFVTDQDLQRSDQYVADLISAELLHWKRRSLRPTPEFSVPAHGFMLFFVSKRVAYASPDNNLLDFARHLLRLLSQEGVGAVYWQNLFLSHPLDNRCLKFTFTVDYFGAQGDGRWWHDHRVPGGVAFSANSVGHMKWYAQWYETERSNYWEVRKAMETIEGSATT